jgi:glucosyl-dolichyl phosphate glucuronosyltransferase
MDVEVPFSIIIATSGRVDRLRRLLDSLCRVGGREEIKPEIIVANNAPDDRAAHAVEAVVREYEKLRGNCRQVREPLPGKCRAQNRAIPQARAAILIFLDDDVEVAPEWLQAIDNFFASNSHEAMQGSILMRDEDRKDPELNKALQRYRTIDFINYSYPPGADLKTLTGGNIAVRREVFERIGLFNDRLGPGQGGFSEDVEFAQRLLKAGMRIGYQPKAAVYNEIEPSRLTEEYFRIRHERQGRSRLIHKRNSVLTIIPNLIRSLWAFGWYSLLGNERRTYRAKGRYFHYRAMLVEKARTAKGRQI